MLSTTASPMYMSLRRIMSGTTLGTPPASVWSASRSLSQLCQNDSACISVEAVAANACASPVHPRRSSRCGQSVGTETKLSRCDQNTFSWNLSSASEADRKVERLGRSDEIAIAVAEIASAPVTSACWKPWKVNRGSSTVSPSWAST